MVPERFHTPIRAPTAKSMKMALVIEASDPWARAGEQRGQRWC